MRRYLFSKGSQYADMTIKESCTEVTPIIASFEDSYSTVIIKAIKIFLIQQKNQKYFVKDL